MEVTKVHVPLDFLIQASRFAEGVRELDREADAAAQTFLTAGAEVRLSSEMDNELAAIIRRDEDYWYVEFERREGLDE